LGGFTDQKDTTRPFGKTIEEILKEQLAEYDFPICYGFPVSHDTENYALKVGATVELSITAKTVKLKEIA
jgi:muramoyltetrapeptide carboxypeptidase